MIYQVVSPAYDYVEVVCDDGTGPTESECDYCIVSAASKREAKVKAVRHFRKTRAGYLADPDISPFTGLQVSEANWEDADPDEIMRDAILGGYWVG